MTEEKYREVHILRSGVWYNEGFGNIQKGDIFKMFEPDGTPVEYPEGYFLFRADSAPYKHDEYGVLTIDTSSVDANEIYELTSDDVLS